MGLFRKDYEKVLDKEQLKAEQRQAFTKAHRKEALKIAAEKGRKAARTENRSWGERLGGGVTAFSQGLSNVNKIGEDFAGDMFPKPKQQKKKRRPRKTVTTYY